MLGEILSRNYDAYKDVMAGGRGFGFGGFFPYRGNSSNYYNNFAPFKSLPSSTSLELMGSAQNQPSMKSERFSPT
jgi:hypothetical protein